MSLSTRRHLQAEVALAGQEHLDVVRGDGCDVPVHGASPPAAGADRSPRGGRALRPSGSGDLSARTRGRCGALSQNTSRHEPPHAVPQPQVSIQRRQDLLDVVAVPAPVPVLLVSTMTSTNARLWAAVRV